MSRVLCIDTPKTIDPNAGANPIVKVGHIYHLNTPDCYGDGLQCELVEHIGYAYATRCFAPCSDIDETELIRERQTQHA